MGAASPSWSAETMAAISPVQFLRQGPASSLPPPSTRAGVFGWLRANLFSSPFNITLTLTAILFIAWIVPPLIRFLLIDATWSGADREACIPSPARPNPGACWAFIRVCSSYCVYGFYPASQRWRVDLFFLALAFGVGWLLWLRAPRRDIGAVYFFIVLPIVSLILLGGLPLITLLFMASVMLPLFVPEPLAPDKLVRALIGVAMFASAYMAEVVRGGLLAIARGQYEAAQALGLTYWRMTALIILPQALRVTLPNIVNVFIALFKDTTLVFIVGIFDFLRTVEVARGDQKWASPITSLTGYAFAALFYFVCCYAMSRYAQRVEARLARRSAYKGR